MSAGIGMGELLICGVVLIGTVAVIVVALVAFFFLLPNRRNAGAAPTPPQNETSLDVLKARYARGEISQEQYEQMKKNLSS